MPKKSFSNKKLQVLREEAVTMSVEANGLNKKEEPSSFSPKAQKIQSILDKAPGEKYGPHALSTVALIISELLGEKVTFKERRKTFKKLQVIVIEDNPNSHNYPLDEPVMVINESNYSAITSEGFRGNSVPLSARLATVEEIKTFVDKLTPELLVELYGKAQIIKSFFED